MAVFFLENNYLMFERIKRTFLYNRYNRQIIINRINKI